MLIENKKTFYKFNVGFINSALLICALITEISAQVRSVPVAPAATSEEDFTWWYVMLFVLALGLGGAIFWWLNAKKAQNETSAKGKPASGKDNNKKETKTLDAGKELEWLKKNPKLAGKQETRKTAAKKRPSKKPQAEKPVVQNEAKPENPLPETVETNAPSLPIFSFQRLEFARPFETLPVSEDENLLDAIDQSYDEFEEDEEVRELALRVLTAYKTQNSVEALSQIALYDLSSNLRSKAVTVLSEFDHESVFEAILLANADPTREVRAAAARSLSKLSFDRADAWTRIAETGDEGRMVQAARAAIESGFVDMSFDRLAHPDRKYAYEAFALMSLLIKAGETEKIFNALETHRDMKVRRAILHTIKVNKDQRSLDGLYLLLEKNNLPIEFQEEIDKTIEEIGFVTV